jgi:hypothetical protein
MDCDDHSDQITAMKREFDERVILDLKEQLLKDERRSHPMCTLM